jgi:diguanylate cyclase (GGDEF)-like protein
MHGLHYAAATQNRKGPEPFLASIQRFCPSDSFITVMCMTLVLLVSGLEGYLGKVFQFDFELTPLYLLPVSMMAWCKGFRHGALLAVVASVFATIMSFAGVYSRHPTLGPIIVNAVLDLGTMTVASFMVAEVRYLLNHEKELSRTDHVTGIKNTRSFWETLSIELDRMRRYSRPLTIAYIDIDDFKKVNDEYGHRKGDELLRLIGVILTDQVRSNDVVARVGGDEFAICFPETDEAASKVIVERLRAYVNHYMSESGFNNGLSIGVVTFSTAPSTVEMLIHMADDLMYSVKTHGKGQVAFHTV